MGVIDNGRNNKKFQTSHPGVIAVKDNFLGSRNLNTPS